ncbi:MAG: hypothetical protein ACYDHZ_00420 [Dehalococcoidia bacterium]
MQLNIMERMILLNILPAEGDYSTLKILRQLREDLSFTEDEHKTVNFEKTPEGIKWETDKDFTKDVQIGPKANQIITECLKQLDNNKKLTEQVFPLYEKFVVNPE